MGTGEINRQNWENWCKENPDLFSSVHRSRNVEELKIGIKDISQKLSLHSGERVLDAGCGSGVFLSELVKFNKVSGVGIDFSKPHIKFAKKNFPFIDFSVASLQDLPFKTCTFDKVLTYSVIQCIDNWQDALLELLRVCKPGGMVLAGDIPSVAHKHKSYLNSISGLLSSLANVKKLKEKFSYLRGGAPWHWMDLSEMKEFIEKNGFYCSVLPQPKHRQFESLTYNYRFDVLIKK